MLPGYDHPVAGWVNREAFENGEPCPSCDRPVLPDLPSVCLFDVDVLRGHRDDPERLRVLQKRGLIKTRPTQLADHIDQGGRVGLVGTNSISQNRARGASLDYVVARGGVIVSALSSEKWPGDAKVHVSIVNWIQAPSTVPTRFVLDDLDVMGSPPRSQQRVVFPRWWRFQPTLDAASKVPSPSGRVSSSMMSP